MTAIVALFIALADLTAAKAELNLERRSDLAIDNAGQAIEEARAAYRAGDTKKTEADLAAVRESVDLSLESLSNSGKRPRSSSHYKKAEQKLGQMLRRLSAFRDEMSVDDRKPVDDVVTRLQEVHDALLADIMSKKR